MIVKYVNSAGISFNLECDNLWIKSGNFHNFSWKPKTEELQYGDTIKNFTKQSITYELTLKLRGTIGDRMKLLNRFHDATETDILNNSPGRLWFGEYHIDCYIISSSTSKSEEMSYWTEKKIEAYCPYPFWVRNLTKEFPIQEPGTEDYLDFSFDFSFDFMRESLTDILWPVGHFSPSNFKITIYGACENPRVLINGYPYQIFATLAENEYLVIDSRENTVVKYLNDGTTENLYNNRSFENSVFEKMPAGNLTIDWDNTFGFDITLDLERSEPEWVVE